MAFEENQSANIQFNFELVAPERFFNTVTDSDVYDAFEFLQQTYKTS